MNLPFGYNNSIRPGLYVGNDSLDRLPYSDPRHNLSSLSVRSLTHSRQHSLQLCQPGLFLNQLLLLLIVRMSETIQPLTREDLCVVLADIAADLTPRTGLLAVALGLGLTTWHTSVISRSFARGSSAWWSRSGATRRFRRVLTWR